MSTTSPSPFSAEGARKLSSRETMQRLMQVIKLLEARHWQSGQLGDALSEYLSEDVL